MRTLWLANNAPHSMHARRVSRLTLHDDELPAVQQEGKESIGQRMERAIFGGGSKKVRSRRARTYDPWTIR